MLYSGRRKKLSIADFKNPASEYRGTPFWAWNNKLDKKELLWQIEQLKKMGYGGFHMHVRTGMATSYLSDEYMEIVKACVEKAREEKMLAWLYDEDRWPSGAAGGIVTKDPKNRIIHLLLTRKAYGEAVEVIPEKRSRASSARCENGRLLKCFHIVLNNKGELSSYKTIAEDYSLSKEDKGFKLYAYEETALPNPWFNNQTYVNTLNPSSIKEFIDLTYGTYSKYFKEDFGNVIPAIFTDEPQFSQKGTLNFAEEEKDITLPWTFDLEDTYKAAYGGESLLEALPELLWDLQGGRLSKIRYHYHDHVAERFSAAFADQCGSWCKKNGIMLTGHMMEEATLESQTHALGEAMRSYRSFQLPGIDMLCDRHEYTTAKQAQSAARQMGAPGTLSELYGVTNWCFDFRGHKLQGDWQAALGVTVRVPHLSWVSMNGEAKRDYPSTFNYQSPWYTEYPYVEDHFARLATVLTRGKAVSRVGVIHPIESYWLYWGAKENTAAIREEMDRNFINLCDWLLKGLIDFDYICESTLPLYCNINDIGTSFPVGEMNYDVVLVPPLKTIRQTTLERLEAFKNSGGRLIFLGEAPEYMDAYINDAGRKLHERTEHYNFEKLSILNALGDVRDIEIKDSGGRDVNNLLYQLRKEDENGDTIRWLFVAHAENPKNPDLPKEEEVRIKINGEWQVDLFNTINGEISSLPARHEGGFTYITQSIHEHDSLLFKLVKNSGVQEAVLQSTSLAPNSACIRFLDPVPVSLEEPNVLLLDMAEYALTEGRSELLLYRKREEILRLDNILRTELNWPLRGEAWAQPWVENDEGTPYTLNLRYVIESRLNIQGAELALENAENTRITLNGMEADKEIKGWYVDKCIKKRSLPEIISGTNILELSFPYGKKTDVEAAYLLGDFAVHASGTSCVISSPVKTLTFGDIVNQGLPFYGGNITYHLEAEIDKEKIIFSAANYRGHLLKLKFDGLDKGHIVYSPYRLEISRGTTDKAKHKFDLVYFGSRINTFGQLHCVEREEGFWWGPNSWRTLGDNWTYEYKFWPQGVLKSPEIIPFP